MEPNIILLDEPTSALDVEMVREVLDVMKELARSGITMPAVTHETGFAREAADRIVLFDEGQIVEDRAPEEFFNNRQAHPGQSVPGTGAAAASPHRRFKP